MPAPTAEDIAAFLGRADDPQTVALAGEARHIIIAMARAYTRGNGFTDYRPDGTTEPNADIAAVITTATARLMANPDQIRHTVGSVTLDGFTGWTLAELFVLNRYRRRAV